MGTRRRGVGEASALALVMLCGSSTSCFLGYDSRWGDEARAQKVIAKQVAPDELQGTPTEATATKLRVMRVRAFVSDRYSAEVSDEQRQITRLIDNANEVLGPTLDLQLDVVDIKRWAGSEDNALEPLVDELEALDAGSDVAWVIGFVGKPAALEVSFKQLGMARSPGKHLVMRAMNDAIEYDAVEKHFAELDEGERRDLYRKRLEHKETTIFLHELGHSLGVPHTRKSATIMHSVYDDEASRFSYPAAQLMRIVLDHRVDPTATSDAQLAEALVAHLQTTSKTWVDADRDRMLALFRPQKAAAAEKRPEAFADAAHWRALSDGDRVRFSEASRLEAEGKRHEALEKAQPLFEAHPDSVEIQEMRCRLAMFIGGNAAAIETHCAAFKRLESQR